MSLVGRPLGGRPRLRAGLFWFTISPLLTGRSNDGEAPVAAYLDRRPAIILTDIRALPDRTMHSRADAENAPPTARAPVIR